MYIATAFVPSTRLEKEQGFWSGGGVGDAVDGDDLAQQVEEVCNEMIDAGLTIINIMPVTSGGNNFRNGVGYGYGYGFTSGVIIVASGV